MLVTADNHSGLMRKNPSDGGGPGVVNSQHIQITKTIKVTIRRREDNLTLTGNEPKPSQPPPPWAGGVLALYGGGRRCGYNSRIAAMNLSKLLKGNSGSGSSRRKSFSAPVMTWISSHCPSSRSSCSSEDRKTGGGSKERSKGGSKEGSKGQEWKFVTMISFVS